MTVIFAKAAWEQAKKKSLFLVPFSKSALRVVAKIVEEHTSSLDDDEDEKALLHRGKPLLSEGVHFLFFCLASNESQHRPRGSSRELRFQSREKYSFFGRSRLVVMKSV